MGVVAEADVAFHIKAEIQWLSKTVCEEYLMSVRFINFLGYTLKDFVFETGE